MKAYFIRRILLIPPTFLGITVLVFTITRFVPGGPIERMIAQTKAAALENGSSDMLETGSELSDEQLRELEAYYGFDKPTLQSYLDWLGKVLVGDLGESSRYTEPVWKIIKEKFPVSVFYGVMTMILTYLVCIPLGILKALRHGSHFDHISSMLVFVGYAVPGFVVGMALLIVFASNLEWFPLGGFVSDDFSERSLGGRIFDILHHAFLPLCAYMAGSFAVMTFLMKNSLMENLSADYIRTAMAKGNSYRQAVIGHALQNSLIPLATHFGNNISVILAGSFLVEKVFDIDGMGLLAYDSILERDYPVVLGILVISSLLQLVGNILSDVCVALVDPRVQFE